MPLGGLNGLQEMKRVIISKARSTVTVAGEVSYLGETGEAKNMLKQRKTHKMVKLDLVKAQRAVPDAKYKDVVNLLKVTFGDEWETFENLSFYKTIKISAGADGSLCDEPTDDCNCCTPDIGVYIFVCLLAQDFEF